MEYQVNFGFHAFSVPSAVVDTLIRVSKENQLKVLLYLLRHPDKQFSVSHIASYLKIGEDQVQEAFEWWAEVNILQEKIEEKHLEEKQLELFPAIFSAPEVQPPSPPVPEKKPVSEKNSSHKKKEISDPFTFFSNENIHEIITSSPELNRLINTAQREYYQKAIYAQAKSLVWMYEYLGLPVEVIFILLRYCRDVGKIHQQKYIDSIALGWYQDEIFTAEDAEKRVSTLMEFYTFTNYICRLFELDAKPTKNQKEFIGIWQTMNFSEELLKYARDLSVEAIGKINFKYIHSILSEWHNNNVTELEEAEAKHDEYIKAYTEQKRKNRKNKHHQKDDSVVKERMEELDKYVDLIN